MNKLRIVRSKSTVAGLAVALVAAASSRAAVIHVPADYATIQGAVDAASDGDEIQIGAGVYANQVVIAHKNLTLSGSPGAVLRATSDMQATLAPYTGAIPIAAVLGIFEADVVVSGLTFEGEHLGDRLTNSLNGILFFAAGGRVENCRICGFRGDTLLNDATDSGWGYGVHVVNPRYGGGVINVDVVRSTFADNAVSINLIGDGGPTADTTLLRTTFTVSDNTILGNGPDANGRQFGIWIWTGAGGEVKRNIIADHAYTGTNETIRYSFGIVGADPIDSGRDTPLVALQPLVFEENILTNNQVGLLVPRGDGSAIVNNLFEGTTPGLRPTALVISGDHVLLGTNRFSDLPTGILLLGDDPEFGTSLGIASNAKLVANGFCHVATNLTVEPLATYTEHDTLTCPEPPLGIAQAILLSWPYAYKGYSVETAPAPNGPWTPSSAVPFLRDGRNSLVIPAENGRQFFRLVKP